MGALVPVRLENLIAGNKNIGTTHITNGCYRLHPIEWNIGEAAGTLVGLALETGQPPHVIHGDRDSMRTLQRELLDEGVPLAWTVDVPVSHPDFLAVQRLVMAGGYGGRDDTLEFGTADPIDATDRRAWMQAIAGSDIADPCGTETVSRAAFAQSMVHAGLI
jgi:hypothetical protein